ncbi:MAG TPA: hypothetical protein VK614_11425 [Allosphingosinicella sp.]|nr:hypothetical protein [Allosphingosinicella sp.]
MSLALMMLVQAAAPAPPALAAVDFDLARYQSADAERWAFGPACDRADPSAIVVCGRRGRGTYPLDEMAELYEPRRILAETGIVGNLRGFAGVEAVELQPGVVSNRLLVGIRVPF